MVGWRTSLPSHLSLDGSKHIVNIEHSSLVLSEGPAFPSKTKSHCLVLLPSVCTAAARFNKEIKAKELCGSKGRNESASA